MECEIVGVTEIGDVLGASRQRAGAARRDAGFLPAPIAELASGRIWRAQDVRLWSETRRRGGRPRTASRIEYVGDRDREAQRSPNRLQLRLVWIEEPRQDRAIHRWIDRGLFGFVNQQLTMERPPALALRSVRRALANLCGLQMRSEIDHADFVIDRIPIEAQLDHRWSQYLLSYSEKVRHPIQDLHVGEALHAWIDEPR